MFSIVVSALLVGASNAPPEAKLVWQDFKADQSITQQLPLGFYGMQGGAPIPTGYKAPAGVFKAHFFGIFSSAGRSDGRGSDFVAFSASSKKTGAMDLLYVDWNRDRKFSKTEIAKGVQSKVYTEGKEFTFPVGPKGPDGTIRVKVLVVGSQMYSLIPMGCMQGVAEFGGEKKTVMLVDVDCNGVFNGRDYISFGPQTGFTPVPALMQFPDGSFWVPSVSADGTRLSMAEDTTSTGVLEFVGADPNGVSLGTKRGPVSLAPNQGKITLPAGAYTVDAVACSATDDAGKTWTASMYSNGKSVVVKAGETTSVTVGKPLKLGVNSSQDGGNVVFGLEVKDVGGFAVGGLYSTEGLRPPAPNLTIKDPNGKVVKTMPFSYG